MGGDQMNNHELSYDVLIVGGGPAGLGAAIRLKQLDENLKVCLLEKGAEVGRHILSGAVLDPRSLQELFPDWQTRGAPLTTPVTRDNFLFLTPQKAFSLPVPPPLRNKGNYVASLGALCQWLAMEAEGLGVEIYPGFAGAKCLFNERGEVLGVEIGPLGLDSKGKPTPRFEAGVKIRGKLTFLAEGCRGSLSQEIIKKYKLDQNSDPQTYGLGLKEIWEIDPLKSTPGQEFPGGCLMGCAAGFLNVAKLKGSHTALKSGMLAAEAAHDFLIHKKPFTYQKRLQKSWINDELYKVRNIRPGFQKSLWRGLINATFETYFSCGRSPWTLKNQADHLQLKPAKECAPIVYPKPDGKITFDPLTSLYLAHIRSEDRKSVVEG